MTLYDYYFSEVVIRQLFALKTTDGNYVDFRQFADADMSAIAALIESEGSEELKASVVVNTEVSSQTEVKRLSEAVTLYLEGTYYEADINVVIEQMMLAYEEIGKISQPSCTYVDGSYAWGFVCPTVT